MSQTDLLKKYLDAGVAFTQMTQSKAEAIVRDLVRAGEVQTGDTRQRVEELLDRSRQNTDNLVKLVRTEVSNQVAKLGLVPKKELDAVRRELAQVKAQQAKTVVKSAPAKKAAAKAPVKKAPAKKAPVKKATTKKAGTAAKKA
jgi:polyhydroxyalkanoate synthesis regulator phasin